MLVALHRRSEELTSTTIPLPLRSRSGKVAPDLVQWEARLIASAHESTSPGDFASAPAPMLFTTPLFSSDALPPYNPLVRARQDPPPGDDVSGEQSFVEGTDNDWVSYQA